MAYLEHGMWEILEVLRRIHRGEGRRSVSRNTGRDRKTIARYVALAEGFGWVAGLNEPDEALAEGVASQLRPGPSYVTPGAVEKLLLQHQERLRGWLDPDNPYQRGLTLAKVLILLKRQGVEVSYSSLRRFAVKHLGFGRKQTTVRLEGVAPGELAEVDFGRLGMISDPETGKKRLLHALVVTLVFSRHQYVHVTHSQKLKDLIDGLEDAWELFGGVPSRVVVDNLKAAVTKADRYDPVFQRTFEEYARHRGFVIDSTVPKHPKGKPHVERQVPYVRENFFRGEHFLSRDHAQEEAIRWCLTTAGLRTHGTTRKQPLTQFETIEKAALAPLVKERFDTPRWATPKVHPDCHVRFNYALYSAPYRYKGKKATVRGDSKLVRIYVGGKLVKTHPTQPPGGNHTDHDDYPPEKTPYTMRDANYLIRRARERGESIGAFTERLLSGTFPWAKLRSAQKLLRLCDRYGDQRMESACRRALHFDLINVHRVQRIVEKGLERDAAPSPRDPRAIGGRGQVIQLPLRFLREAQSFNHNQAERKEE